MTEISYPLVNGVRHEWSSIEIKLGTDIYLGVKEISYKHGMKPKKVYGTHPQPIGRTRGVYEPEASITLWFAEANKLRKKLGAGFFETPFDITVSYSENGFDTVVDLIQGARIVSDDMSPSQGEDPIEVKFELDVMLILANGVNAVKNPLKGVTV